MADHSVGKVNPEYVGSERAAHAYINRAGTYQDRLTRIGNLVETAEQFDEYSVVVGAYLRTATENFIGELPEGTVGSPGKLLARIIDSATNRHEDVSDGSAPTIKLTDLIEPAMHVLLSNEGLRGIYREADHVEQRSLYRRVFGSLQSTFRHGSAQYVTGSRLMSLARREYSPQASRGGGVHDRVYLAERYPTQRAFAYLFDKHQIGQREMPPVSDTVPEMDSLIVDSVKDLASEGNGVAQQILRNLQTLREPRLDYGPVREGPRYASASMGRYLSTLAIGKSLAPQLEKLFKYKAPFQFDSLEERDPARLQDVYGRILYAASGDVYRQAVTSNLYDGSIWRARMVYLEALSRHYSGEKPVRRYSQGDVALKLKAQGMTTTAIQRTLAKAAEL